MTKQKRAHFFTLTELLVVIAVIALLISLLQPALVNAIYKTKLTTCALNQKNLVTIFAIYADDFDNAYPRNQSYRGGVENIGTYGRNDQIRDMIKPYFGVLEDNFRCAGISQLPKSKNLDTVVEYDTMPTDYYMYFNVTGPGNNGWAIIGMHAPDGHSMRKVNPKLQMTHVGKTWSPMFMATNENWGIRTTVVPEFDLVTSDMIGNHIAPFFNPVAGTGSGRYRWTGGPSDMNHCFEDGHVELVPALHDDEKVRKWYNGFPIDLLEKWVVGTRNRIWPQ